jgi:hypothetical protein
MIGMLVANRSWIDPSSETTSILQQRLVRRNCRDSKKSN